MVSSSQDQEPAVSVRQEAGNYGQILMSTALVGGTSAINLAVGLVRSKAIALLLGPAGTGLNSTYASISSLAETLAGMGINGSGVRQIAEAVGSGDHSRVAKTAAVLRWTSLTLGVVGAAALVALAGPVSRLTFGDASQTSMIAILAAGLLFRVVSTGQGALLQGLRRIPEMAQSTILGSLGAALVTVPLVWWLGVRGVAVSVVAGSAVGLAATWWFSRRLEVAPPRVSAKEVREEAGTLLHLGGALMVSGLVTAGSSYGIRAAILRQLGIDAAGLYGAAWTVGSMYVGFILQAMGTDFYPRLTGSIHDNDASNQLVNEQAHVSLLLAGTGVIGTLTFAPLVLHVLYAASFQPAVEVLRWVCLGTALQVVSWPLGFIIVAKGRKGALVVSEVAWAAVHLGLAWVCLARFGLTGAGIAFFGSYAFHVGLTYFMANRLTGFHWSGSNRAATLQYLAGIAGVFGATLLLPGAWAMGVGAVAMVACAVYSVRALSGFVSLGGLLPGPALRVLRGLGALVPGGSR